MTSHSQTEAALGAFVTLHARAREVGLEVDDLAMLCRGLDLKPFRDEYCDQLSTLSAVLAPGHLELTGLMKGVPALSNNPRSVVVDVEMDWCVDGGCLQNGRTQRFAIANSSEELSRAAVWSFGAAWVSTLRLSQHWHEHGEWPAALLAGGM